MMATSQRKKIPVPAIRISSTPYSQAEPSSPKNDGDVKHIEKELKFDLHRPLIDTLQSVFDCSGKVVITFPDTPRFTVSKDVAS